MNQIRNILEQEKLVRIFVQGGMQEDIGMVMALQQVLGDGGSGQFKSSGSSDDTESYARCIARWVFRKFIKQQIILLV